MFVLFNKKTQWHNANFHPNPIACRWRHAKKRKVVNSFEFGGNMETAMRSGWKYVSQQKCVIRRQTVDVFPWEELFSCRLSKPISKLTHGLLGPFGDSFMYNRVKMTDRAINRIERDKLNLVELRMRMETSSRAEAKFVFITKLRLCRKLEQKKRNFWVWPKGKFSTMVTSSNFQLRECFCVCSHFREILERN